MTCFIALSKICKNVHKDIWLCYFAFIGPTIIGPHIYNKFGYFTLLQLIVQLFLQKSVKWQQKISLFFFLEIILIHQELHIAKIASSP